MGVDVKMNMKKTTSGRYFKKAATKAKRSGITGMTVPFTSTTGKDIFSDAMSMGMKTGSRGLVPKRRK